ncbi:putative MATE family efflux protein [Methanococcus maripaludis]|uniref:Multidrug export protein MepA n=1 Tax=Methanococcus maripaludis TaxID=39152 RepID=A0A7J9NJ72_METMI|nr:MATE family efflux transporter [Methanococcus maripaludis]MBA2840976.1 putative MATE family efflux protein [Methanococcus maripaludis]
MKNDDLSTDNINKLIAKYAIPSIIGFVVLGIYIIVDGIFLGNFVGPEAIAAVTVAIPYCFVMTGFAIMFGIGASAHISMKLGAKKKEEAEKILKTVFYMIVIGGVILTVLGLTLIKPLLVQFGITGNLLEYSYTYLQVSYLACVFIMVRVGLDPVIRNDGFPKKAMFTVVLGAILNIVFDAIFIVFFGWGVFGAALASVTGETFGALVYLHHFLGGKSNLKLDLSSKFEDLKSELEIVKNIIAVGISPFILELSASVVMVLHTIQFLKYGSPLEVSAYGIVSYLFALVMLVYMGLCNGVQPLISYNYGAKQYSRVKEILKTTGILTVIIGLVSFVTLSLFPKIPIMLFNKTDLTLISSTVFGLKYFAYGLSVFGLGFLIITYFQSTGKSKISNFLSLSRTVVFLIPLLVILPIYFGITGIWVSQPLAEVLTLLCGLIFIKSDFKKEIL